MNMYVIKVSIAEHIQLNFNSNVDFTNSKLWKIFIKEDGSTVHSREYQKMLCHLDNLYSAIIISKIGKPFNYVPMSIFT